MLGARVGIMTLVLLAGPLLVRPAYAQAPPPASASAPDKHKAQEKYDEGVRLFNAGQPQAALAAFRASHGIVASPNSGLMIARTQIELGDLAQAYESYEAVEQSARDLPNYKKAGES